MHHEEIVDRIEKRLDIIEQKLDKHLEINATQTADINWIKGNIKIQATVIIALITGFISNFFKSL